MEILQSLPKKFTIYKITDNATQRCYIGSTTMKLSTRISMHKALYKQYIANQGKYASAYEVVKNGNFNTDELEVMVCSKQELRKKEGEYIKNSDSVVNKNIAGRTLSEYQHDNKDKCREYARKSYQKNRAKRIAYGIAYYNKKKLQLSNASI